MTKNKILKIIYVIIILIIIILFSISDNGLVKYYKLKSDIVELDNKIKDAEERIAKLSSEIDSLKTSDVKIEKVARDKYRMKDKNEIPIRINKK